MLGRWIQYVAIRWVISIVGMLPIECCESIARGLAWLLTHLVKFRRRVIVENLTAVYPEMTPDEVRETTRKMWFHLIMMAFEVVHTPRRIHDTNYLDYVKLPDQALMTEYLIDYRALVAVTGHFGNFEVAGYLTGLLGMPSYTVARKLDNEFLDDYVNTFRGTHGQFILPKDGSANRVQEVMEGGAILTILGDQHAGTKGCWIDFLGRPAACHKAVALFTLSGNAPMMVTYCKRMNRPLHFEVGCTGIADPLDMPETLKDTRHLTQWYNDRMADAIHRDPEQYWWVHRRWKEKPVRKTRKQRDQMAA
ncbi:MAG: lysophospholipid acyltransferase family protein [Mariniblastus sp.]|nr:lysophospholipid acyltransferase family protein [Mariniblastus sp.]